MGSKCEIKDCELIGTDYQCKNCPNQVFGVNNVYNVAVGTGRRFPTDSFRAVE